MKDDFELDYDDVTGRSVVVDLAGKREPDLLQRYRIYRRHYVEEEPYLLATCESEEDIGVALCEMARDGQLDNVFIGILDMGGEEGKRWLLLPWLPKA